MCKTVETDHVVTLCLSTSTNTDFPDIKHLCPGTPSPSITVQWRAAVFDSALHASCASYEVEAARAPGSSGGTMRQSCGARVNECVLANAAPDASYLVRRAPSLSLLNRSAMRTQ